MIKSKELTDPSSCMSRARDDEMTFVLLARDAAAPFAILAWRCMRVLLGKNKGLDAQIVEAGEAAAAMAKESGADQYDKSAMFVTLGLCELMDRAHNNSVDHGFWDEHLATLPAMPTDVMASKIALMHSELSECLEGIRKPGPDSHCPDFTSEEIELADAIIRIADYSGARQLRLSEAVLAKMQFNATRPHKHGKAI